MKIHLTGFVIERNRNGSPRYRVRVEGQPGSKITIPVGPDHKDFQNHYQAARAGDTWKSPIANAPVESLDWLAGKYLTFLEKMVDASQMSPATLKQRRSVLTRLCDFQDSEGGRYGDFHIDAPTAAFVEIRDAWADKPGAADNLTKSIRAVYKWAMERGIAKTNPAAGIGNINTNPKGGAKAWTAHHLKKFKERHPFGTTAHLWLTLQAFTACRIGDAVWLGRDQEVTYNGDIWLEWQPRKKGSAPVSLPMLPPLYEATRHNKVVGSAYILSEKGKPFRDMEALRSRVQKWCTQAEIPGYSSHGVRKAVGELLAEAGCSQHQIMSVMAHTQAKTSEIYTRGAERRVLAGDAMRAIAHLKW